MVPARVGNPFRPEASGRQLVLRRGDQEAVVTELGAGLRRYRVGGVDLVDGYSSQERARDGRGQLLLPWPNRTRDGRYAFQGSWQQLPINELERSNAIHGLTRWWPWWVEYHSKDSARLSLVLYPQPGYDFTLGLDAVYQLDDQGLEVTVTATNLGAGALPYGAGSHPYLCLGTALVDDLTLTIPAGSWLETDHRGIPSGGRLPVEGTPLDFRRPRQLGQLKLDTTFTDLAQDPRGRVLVALSSPLGTLTMWADPSCRFVQIYTGDAVSDAKRRRQGLAVEPMTCAPDALRSGDGLAVLASGASHQFRWGLSMVPAEERAQRPTD